MQEPFLYLDEVISKAKPGARAPAGSRDSYEKKVGKKAMGALNKTPAASKNPKPTSFGPSARPPNTTANPSAPSTSPKTPKTPDDVSSSPALVPCPFGGGAECKAHGGNGAASHKPGSKSAINHTKFQEKTTTKKEDPAPEEQAAVEEQAQEPKVSDTQKPEKQVVSSGDKNSGLVSSSEAKVNKESKRDVTASKLEQSKRNRPKGSSATAESFSYELLPSQDGDEGVWVKDKKTGFEYDITDETHVPTEYSTLEQVHNDPKGILKEWSGDEEGDHGQEHRIAREVMRWKSGQRLDSEQEKKQAKEKEASKKEEAKAAKETMDQEKHQANLEKVKAQTDKIKAETKQVGKKDSSTSKKKPASNKDSSKKPGARAPAGSKEKFESKMGERAMAALNKKPKTSSSSSEPASFKKPSDRAKVAADQKDRVEEARKKVAADANGPDGPDGPDGPSGGTGDSGSSSGGSSKKKETTASKKRLLTLRGAKTAFDAGRVAGTRIGEAAATADAGGYLLSAGVEYGIGGAIAAGQHLLRNDKNKASRPPGKKTTNKNKKSSEVEQSSMKSLPIYLDLQKAIQMPNAGGTTPDEKRARAQHISSYAKRPVGVANEGIVKEDDPDKGKRWTHEEDDSVQSEVDNEMAAKKDEDEEENKVNKAIEMLKSLNSGIREEVSKCVPNSLEASFMVEELGYDPLRVSKGLMFIKGKDRHRFNEWAHRRLSKSIASLTEVSGFIHD